MKRLAVGLSAGLMIGMTAWLMAQPTGYVYTAKGQYPVAIYDGGTQSRTASEARTRLSVPSLAALADSLSYYTPTLILGDSLDDYVRIDGTRIITGPQTFTDTTAMRGIHLRATNAANIPLVVEGYVGQSAPLSQWWARGGNSSNYLAQIGTDGTITTYGDVMIVNGNTMTLQVPSLSDAQTQQFDDLSGTLIVRGSGSDPPGTGEIAIVNRDVTADVGPVNLTDTTPAGFYEVTAYLTVTVASTAGTEQPYFSLTYTDDTGAQTVTIATLDAMASGTFSVGTAIIYLASGNITWSTNDQVDGTIKLRARCTYKGA